MRLPNRKENSLTTIYCYRMPNWNLIPEHIRDSLRLYIEEGYHPGSGLTAILSNDLVRTAHHADDINWAHMRDIVLFLFEYVPVQCWGSAKKFERWCKRGGFNRRRRS
jgi:hypothetical protein